ncbi:MAG: hypothetical protein OXT67_13495 [Zetaproteobacteria bacterium]|nr:hypothetical protein [Zetaproteobacteria bacterium]
MPKISLIGVLFLCDLGFSAFANSKSRLPRDVVGHIIDHSLGLVETPGTREDDASPWIDSLVQQDFRSHLACLDGVCSVWREHIQRKVNRALRDYFQLELQDGSSKSLYQVVCNSKDMAHVQTVDKLLGAAGDGFLQCTRQAALQLRTPAHLTWMSESLSDQFGDFLLRQEKKILEADIATNGDAAMNPTLHKHIVVAALMGIAWVSDFPCADAYRDSMARLIIAALGVPMVVREHDGGRLLRRLCYLISPGFCASDLKHMWSAELRRAMKVKIRQLVEQEHEMTTQQRRHYALVLNMSMTLAYVHTHFDSWATKYYRALSAGMGRHLPQLGLGSQREWHLLKKRYFYPQWLKIKEIPYASPWLVQMDHLVKRHLPAGEPQSMLLEGVIELAYCGLADALAVMESCLIRLCNFEQR